MVERKDGARRRVLVKTMSVSSQSQQRLRTRAQSAACEVEQKGLGRVRGLAPLGAGLPLQAVPLLLLPSPSFIFILT